MGEHKCPCCQTVTLISTASVGGEPAAWLCLRCGFKARLRQPTVPTFTVPVPTAPVVYAYWLRSAYINH
jgi:hypothetical protein